MKNKRIYIHLIAKNPQGKIDYAALLLYGIPFPIIAIQLNRPEKASKVFEKCEYIEDATNFLLTP